MATQSISCAKSPSFLGLALHNKWQDGKADGRVNSAEVLPTSYNKNSSGDEIANVNFYAVRPEATRIR